MLEPIMAATGTSVNKLVRSKIFQKFNLFGYVGRYAKSGHFALGSLHEILYVGLDDASDTLPKVRPAYGEDRDGLGQKGRHSLW